MLPNQGFYNVLEGSLKLEVEPDVAYLDSLCVCSSTNFHDALEGSLKFEGEPKI